MPSPPDVQFWWMWTDIADTCTLLSRMLLKFGCCYKPYRHDWTLRTTEGFGTTLLCTCKQVQQSHYRPGQALRFPEGWGSQIQTQSANEGGKVSSHTHRPPLPPRKYSWWYSFLVEAESTRPEGFCQWKIPVTPWGSEPATLRLVAQCLINKLHHSADTWLFLEKKSLLCKRVGNYMEQLCIYRFAYFCFFIRICHGLCAGVMMMFCNANCVQLLSVYDTAISKNKEIRWNVMRRSHFVAPWVDFFARLYLFAFRMCTRLYNCGLCIQDQHVNRHN